MVYILGLDALEYDFVRAWNLRNLSQAQSCKIKVPIDEDYGVPRSPTVWASFLTGQLQKKDFIPKPIWYRVTIEVLKLLRRHIPMSLGIASKLSKRVSVLRFPSLEEKTFVDRGDYLPINVPYINHDYGIWLLLGDYIKGRRKLSATIHLLRCDYRRRLCYLMARKYNSNVFAFINNLDTIQHLSYHHPEILQDVYRELDGLVGRLRDQVLHNLYSPFWIVSDHGFDLHTKTHSKHGFFSSNIPLERTPQRITDFYNLVLEELP